MNRSPDPQVVTPVAPGVWRVTTPLPFRPREVHAYLIEREPGQFALVDGGIESDEAWSVLDDAVHHVAGRWSGVVAHLVTHMHMDHIGLVRRVRAACAAPLLMGRLDAERSAHAAADPAEEAAYRERLFAEHGAPPEVREALRPKPRENRPSGASVPADHLLDGETGAVPELPGWTFVWTPGHTAGHISLHRPADDLLIAGDAVLPRVTPTIGVNRQRPDPVGDYLAALTRLEGLQLGTVLPGHGDAITEPAVRLAELRRATEEESRAVGALLNREAASAWQIAQARYAGRDLPLSTRVQALRETLAHLHRLVMSGAACAETVAQETRFTRRSSV